MTRKPGRRVGGLEHEIELAPNPSDNQAARVLIDDVRARRVWKERSEER